MLYRKVFVLTVLAASTYGIAAVLDSATASKPPARGATKKEKKKDEKPAFDPNDLSKLNPWINSLKKRYSDARRTRNVFTEEAAVQTIQEDLKAIIGKEVHWKFRVFKPGVVFDVAGVEIPDCIHCEPKVLKLDGPGGIPSDVYSKLKSPYDSIGIRGKIKDAVWTKLPLPNVSIKLVDFQYEKTGK